MSPSYWIGQGFVIRSVFLYVLVNAERAPGVIAHRQPHTHGIYISPTESQMVALNNTPGGPEASISQTIHGLQVGAVETTIFLHVECGMGSRCPKYNVDIAIQNLFAFANIHAIMMVDNNIIIDRWIVSG